MQNNTKTNQPRPSATAANLANLDAISRKLSELQEITAKYKTVQACWADVGTTDALRKTLEELTANMQYVNRF